MTYLSPILPCIVHTYRSLRRMHNGVVGGFMHIRRALLARLSDAAYDTIQSFHSDSAICFAIFLHHLPDLTSQHQPTVLLKALEVHLAHPRRSTNRSITSNHFLCADKPCPFPLPTGVAPILPPPVGHDVQPLPLLLLGCELVEHV